jgi:D-alanyl-D-alanine carboxypeptidase
LQALLDVSTGSRRPGILLRVSGPGIEFRGSAGLADVERGEPLSADHLVHVASVGKSFMGVAAARLVAQGSLDLNAPIGTWLPVQVVDRIPSSDAITLRHLLQHTSGIIDVLNEVPEVAAAILADRNRIWTNADLVEFAFDRPLHFEPGSAWRYSNTNYMLVGMIVQSATGRHYAAVLRDQVFDPLGMTSTTTSNREPLRGDPAHGYFSAGGSISDETDLALHWELGSGGQWSTVGDLTTYLRGFFESSQIGGESLRALVLEGSEWAPYGLGMVWADTPYGTMYWHDGLLLGYETYMGYFPDRQTAVVLSATGNSADGAGRLSNFEIFERAFETVFTP